MVELEKRLERKERCQGFETFFVGVILLNCIERMSWAMNRASLTNEIQDVILIRDDSEDRLLTVNAVVARKIHRFVHRSSCTICRVPFEIVPDARDTCGRPVELGRWHITGRS